MLLTRDNLPETIGDVAALDELLCRPSQALIDDLQKVDGDIMVLGVAGKMGPTLAGLAKAAMPGRRIIGVARFSDAGVKTWLEARGIETMHCDLLDEKAIKALPKTQNIIFMAGRKFGAEGDLALTWAMNAHVPALVAQAFAGSRIVAFSTGCVYPFVPVDGKGADETTAPDPPGEYAQSCVGRERMFEYFSRQFATPGRLFRLNYAIDMRYGVLHDIASKILRASRSTSASAMSISSGRAMPHRRRCVVWRIATRRPRRSMSAVTKSWRCAISPQNSAPCSAASPSLSAREQPTAWLTDTSQAVKIVRPADRRYRPADRLDRGLGRARDAEPRQAHQIRGARWPILSKSPLSGSASDDARAGLALSTEAHWNQNEADWRFFLNKGIVFGVRDLTAVWSPPRHCCPTASAMPGSAWCW